MRSVTGILFSYPLIDLLTHYFPFRSEEGDLGRVEERVLEGGLIVPITRHPAPVNDFAKRPVWVEAPRTGGLCWIRVAAHAPYARTRVAPWGQRILRPFFITPGVEKRANN